MPYKDPVKKSEYRKQYRLDNLEYFREYDRNRNRKRDGKLSYALEKLRTPTEVYMFRSAKHRAKVKKLPFTITIDDIIIPEFCPILGIRLERNTTTRGPQHQSPTLDRRDNTLGYVRGNVTVISNKANSCKSDLTKQEIENLWRYVNE